MCRKFCRLHSAFGYRIQDEPRRWAGFILCLLSARTGGAVVKELGM